MNIESIEKRFLEIGDLDIDLTQFPIKQNKNQQVKTNKTKSKEHGEVFTPIWLVDKMVNMTDFNNKTTLDLCAGYGQFTIRMIRKLYNENNNFDLEKFLTETHHFNELQLISCFKLVYIFGVNINLFIGDARKLKLLDDNSKGIWFYSENQKSWINISEQFIKEYQNCFVDKTKLIEEVNFENSNYDFY